MEKSKYVFLCLSAMLVVVACKKFLDTTPKDGSVTDAAFFKTTADFDSYMMGAYQDIAGSFDTKGYCNTVALAGFTSQDLIDVGEQVKPLSQWMVNSNSRILSYWTSFYSIASKVNLILSKLPEASISDSDKTRLEGESLFLRGFAYFNLARGFGNIPLILQPFQPSQVTQGCTPVDSVWAQVIADFSKAATEIPTQAQWGSANLGRATKAAAYAFLANAYMYTKDWADAESASLSLINLGVYSLMPNVRSTFSVHNQNNNEDIFTVQYANSPDNQTTWSGYEVGNLLPTYSAPRNIGAAWAPASGWGELVVNPKLANSFEPGDTRRTELMKVPGEKYKGELMSDTLVIPFDIAQPHSAFSTKWWIGPADETGVSYLLGLDAPLMRYAEFLLNYSEILFMKGKIPEAYHQMNLVRERALLPDLAESSDQEIFMTALMNERRHELNLEPNLWFHYTRTGRFAHFLQTEYGISMNPAWNLFPIPQSERDQNANLCQNPGY